jgi:hypothetical protein
MFSVELSTRKWDGHVVVALDGELDLVDAADVAAALVTVTASPQQVLRVLAITRLTDNFSVHASVEEAAANARRSRRAVIPLRRPRRTHRPHTIVPSGTPGTPSSGTATVLPFPGCGDDG